MDDRPLQLLQRAPEEFRPPLTALAHHAGALSEQTNQELQFEFGKDTIAFIVGCNQFLRLHFRGDRAGRVSLPKAAGLEGDAPDEAVFKMFGWTTVDVDEGLADAVTKAFEDAAAKKAPAF